MAKNAMVTGASRGIGRELALALAGEGYNLSLCCSKSREELLSFAEELRQNYHVTVLTAIGNVADHEFVRAMAERTLVTLGGIDVLINNAGISHIGLLSDMSVEEWNRVIGVNLTSVFLTCKHIVPSMVARKRGKIINISSVWGSAGASCEVAYSAAKGGVNAFTRALGKELAPSNIQVNAIACGIIDTQMNECFSKEERVELMSEIPAGRMGQAKEVAHLALQLIEGNDYLNGQVITLDGGWI